MLQKFGLFNWNNILGMTVLALSLLMSSCNEGVSGDPDSSTGNLEGDQIILDDNNQPLNSQLTGGNVTGPGSTPEFMSIDEAALGIYIMRLVHEAAVGDIITLFNAIQDAIHGGTVASNPNTAVQNRLMKFIIDVHNARCSEEVLGRLELIEYIAAEQYNEVEVKFHEAMDYGAPQSELESLRRQMRVLSMLLEQINIKFDLCGW